MILLSLFIYSPRSPAAHPKADKNISPNICLNHPNGQDHWTTLFYESEASWVTHLLHKEEKLGQDMAQILSVDTVAVRAVSLLQYKKIAHQQIIERLTQNNKKSKENVRVLAIAIVNLENLAGSLNETTLAQLTNNLELRSKIAAS